MTSATETRKNLLHRSALAYVGLYGLAYDRLTDLRNTTCVLRNGTFDTLVEKGEVVEKQAEKAAKQSEALIMKRYAKAVDAIGNAGSVFRNFIPLGGSSKVEAMEAEVEKLTVKLEEMTKTAKTTAKKTTKAATKKAKATTKKVVKASAEATADAAAAIVDAADTVIDKVEATETKTQPTTTPSTKTTTATKEPRHMPYFEDVKRYDPLADEDTVRKIVNHCGIALRSEDARYVACSDESERATVRDSWLKRKLGLEASDKDLDKKVLDVCSVMQRDQRKNRVTFYYLLAKKERKLDTL